MYYIEYLIRKRLHKQWFSVDDNHNALKKIFGKNFVFHQPSSSSTSHTNSHINNNNSNSHQTPKKSERELASSAYSFLRSITKVSPTIRRSVLTSPHRDHIDSTPGHHGINRLASYTTETPMQGNEQHDITPLTTTTTSNNRLDSPFMDLISTKYASVSVGDYDPQSFGINRIPPNIYDQYRCFLKIAFHRLIRRTCYYKRHRKINKNTHNNTLRHCFQAWLLQYSDIRDDDAAHWARVNIRIRWKQWQHVSKEWRRQRDSHTSSVTYYRSSRLQRAVRIWHQEAQLLAQSQIDTAKGRSFSRAKLLKRGFTIWHERSKSDSYRHRQLTHFPQVDVFTKRGVLVQWRWYVRIMQTQVIPTAESDGHYGDQRSSRSPVSRGRRSEDGMRRDSREALDTSPASPTRHVHSTPSNQLQYPELTSPIVSATVSHQERSSMVHSREGSPVQRTRSTTPQRQQHLVIDTPQTDTTAVMSPLATHKSVTFRGHQVSTPLQLPYADDNDEDGGDDYSAEDYAATDLSRLSHRSIAQLKEAEAYQLKRCMQRWVRFAKKTAYFKSSRSGQIIENLTAHRSKESPLQKPVPASVTITIAKRHSFVTPAPVLTRDESDSSTDTSRHDRSYRTLDTAVSVRSSSPTHVPVTPAVPRHYLFSAARPLTRSAEEGARFNYSLIHSGPKPSRRMKLSQKVTYIENKHDAKLVFSALRFWQHHYRQSTHHLRCLQRRLLKAWLLYRKRYTAEVDLVKKCVRYSEKRMCKLALSLLRSVVIERKVKLLLWYQIPFRRFNSLALQHQPTSRSLFQSPVRSTLSHIPSSAAHTPHHTPQPSFYPFSPVRTGSARKQSQLKLSALKPTSTTTDADDTTGYTEDRNILYPLTSALFKRWVGTTRTSRRLRNTLQPVFSKEKRSVLSVLRAASAHKVIKAAIYKINLRYAWLRTKLAIVCHKRRTRILRSTLTKLRAVYRAYKLVKLLPKIHERKLLSCFLRWSTVVAYDKSRYTLVAKSVAVSCRRRAWSAMVQVLSVLKHHRYVARRRAFSKLLVGHRRARLLTSIPLEKIVRRRALKLWLIRHSESLQLSDTRDASAAYARNLAIGWTLRRLREFRSGAESPRQLGVFGDRHCTYGSLRRALGCWVAYTRDRFAVRRSQFGHIESQVQRNDCKAYFYKRLTKRLLSSAPTPSLAGTPHVSPRGVMLIGELAASRVLPVLSLETSMMAWMSELYVRRLLLAWCDRKRQLCQSAHIEYTTARYHSYRLLFAYFQTLLTRTLRNKQLKLASRLHHLSFTWQRMRQRLWTAHYYHCIEADSTHYHNQKQCRRSLRLWIRRTHRRKYYKAHRVVGATYHRHKEVSNAFTCLYAIATVKA